MSDSFDNERDWEAMNVAKIGPTKTYSLSCKSWLRPSTTETRPVPGLA
ncbi:MAG: hypothetical protein QNJ53_15775 [Pleurocapsa sp. MO_192.B19]|nr:hypothetical protein [Pleurocapsa sp. MO_192.B19]